MSSDQAKQILEELAEIKALLTSKPEASRENIISLDDFCKRLGRTRWWGYEQIKARKIIPAKTGKPFLIPVEQLANFLPSTKRAATSRA